MMNDLPIGGRFSDDPEYYTDYENINDIARGEGFVIDDDGHWVPIEAMEEYGVLDYCEDFSQDDLDDDDDYDLPDP